MQILKNKVFLSTLEDSVSTTELTNSSQNQIHIFVYRYFGFNLKKKKSASNVHMTMHLFLQGALYFFEIQGIKYLPHSPSFLSNSSASSFESHFPVTKQSAISSLIWMEFLKLQTWIQRMQTWNMCTVLLLCVLHTYKCVRLFTMDAKFKDFFKNRSRWSLQFYGNGFWHRHLRG